MTAFDGPSKFVAGRPLYVRHSTNRLPKFRMETAILDKGGRRVVRKRALTLGGLAHLKRIQANHAMLAQLAGLVAVPPASLEANDLFLPFIEGRTFEELVVESLDRRDLNSFRRRLFQFQDLIRELAARSKGLLVAENALPFSPPVQSGEDAMEPGILDVTLENVIETPDGSLALIDVEWVVTGPLPLRYLLARALEIFVWKHHRRLPAGLPAEKVFEDLGIDATRRDRYRILENEFQAVVRGPSLYRATGASFHRGATSFAELAARAEQGATLAAAHEGQIAALQSELERERREHASKRRDLDELNDRLRGAHNAISQLELRHARDTDEIESLRKELAPLRRSEVQLREILGSRAWKMVSAYYRLRLGLRSGKR
jgi:hypothetical protein